MSKPILSADRARELFSYNPETGELRWKVRRGPRAPKGGLAGHPSSNGYIRVKVDGVHQLVHRLVWLLRLGAWPKGVIDHRDGSKTNNIFGNLRDVTESTNQENRRTHQANSGTGLLGASAEGDGYAARIQLKGRQLNLGTFDTPNQAHQAYLTAKRDLHAGCTI